MSTAVRHQVLLVAICSLTFFINLGATHLWEEDEAYFGRTAQEMRHRHDYLVPYFNGQISLHKPILLFWVILASFQCWGENEFAARFGSALFGIGNVILVYHLGRRLFSEQIGFWSALVLGTCLHFVVVSRAAVADPELIFFCTLPMLIFVAGTRLSRSRAAAVPVDAAHPVTAEELSWPGWVGIYASMGAAALTKGPVGFVLPTAVIGLFLLLSRADYLAALKTDARRSGLRKLGIWLVRVLWPSSFLRTVWSMRPICLCARLAKRFKTRSVNSKRKIPAATQVKAHRLRRKFLPREPFKVLVKDPLKFSMIGRGLVVRGPFLTETIHGHRINV